MRLTPTDIAVAKLVIAGYSNPEIAAELIMTTPTVENRINKLNKYFNIPARHRVKLALAIDGYFKGC